MVDGAVGIYRAQLARVEQILILIRLAQVPLGVDGAGGIHLVHPIQVGHVALLGLHQLVFAVFIRHGAGADAKSVNQVAIFHVAGRLIDAVGIVQAVAVGILGGEGGHDLGELRGGGGNLKAQLFQPVATIDDGVVGLGLGAGQGVKAAVHIAAGKLLGGQYAGGNGHLLRGEVVGQIQKQAVPRPLLEGGVEVLYVDDVGQVAAGHDDVQPVGVVADRRRLDFQGDAGALAPGLDDGVVLHLEGGGQAPDGREGRLCQGTGAGGQHEHSQEQRYEFLHGDTVLSIYSLRQSLP